MNQFFYTRRQPVAPKEGETEVKFVNFTDSFNLNMIIRTYEYEQGKITVLLSDGHEEAQDRVVEKKNSVGKVVGIETKRERVWLNSEIYLNEEDTKRFWDLYKN